MVKILENTKKQKRLCISYIEIYLLSLSSTAAIRYLDLHDIIINAAYNFIITVNTECISCYIDKFRHQH